MPDSCDRIADRELRLVLDFENGEVSRVAGPQKASPGMGAGDGPLKK